MNRAKRPSLKRQGAEGQRFCLLVLCVYCPCSVIVVSRRSSLFPNLTVPASSGLPAPVSEHGNWTHSLLPRTRKNYLTLCQATSISYAFFILLFGTGVTVCIAMNIPIPPKASEKKSVESPEVLPSGTASPASSPLRWTRRCRLHSTRTTGYALARYHF
jgi:hypothetical protein